jgi:hypothetical protein
VLFRPFRFVVYNTQIYLFLHMPLQVSSLLLRKILEFY